MKAKVKHVTGGAEVLMRDLRGLTGVDRESLDIGWAPEDWIVADFDTVMEATNRIESGPVLIHGDYDADGLCSTAIAKLAMPHAEIYIPSREDGYGLTHETLLELSEDKLVVTVDCGISNLDDMQYAEDRQGRKFIVTDHHEPPVFNYAHTLPVVNPKYSGIGYKGLSGSGVARLFFGQLAILPDNTHAMQLAAIGTMSDMMPMLQWNRPLVRSGLRSMWAKPCPAVKAMARVCNINLNFITEETLSWYFGPILNAAGRRGNLYAAAEMLYTTDYDRAYELAKFLKKDKDLEKKEMAKAAKNIAKVAPIWLSDGIVVVDGTEIPNISTGTTANHAMREYNRPALVYGLKDGGCVGSIRCSDTFDAPELIRQLVRSEYAITGGGHKGAAGLQWSTIQTPRVISYVQSYAAKIHENIGETETYDADIEIDLGRALSLFEAFDHLRPYGMGFEKPTFLSKIGAFDNYRTMGKKKEHCAFEVFGAEIVAFGLADKIPEDANSLMVVYEMSRNASNFGDAGALQIIVRDVEVLS